MSDLLSLLSTPKEATAFIHHHMGNFTIGQGLFSVNADELIMSWLMGGIVLFVAWRVGKRLSLDRPGRLQSVLETVVEFVNNQAKALYPKADPLIGPLALTIFVWVIVMNVMDIVPVDLVPTIAQVVGLAFGVAEPHHIMFRAVPTAGLAVPTALALSIFGLTLLYGIRAKGVLGYLKGYLSHPFGIWLAPFNIAITIVEEIAKPLSLSLRLFGNMFAGDLVFILIALLGFSWFALPIQAGIGFLWTAFETLIILIQAFIFMLLSVVYLALASDAESSH
ncbi:MAG: ATP synthase F0 subunit A [Nevskiaceae bacterium]|nr:MAG: ATP synthase F0 subunit A [Nevskiaceae bacterium]TBR73571.1 MAG: ATP synthase F0 subunit A [Nevskiaceae bacterium]